MASALACGERVRKWGRAQGRPRSRPAGRGPERGGGARGRPLRRQRALRALVQHRQRSGGTRLRPHTPREGAYAVPLRAWRQAAHPVQVPAALRSPRIGPRGVNSGSDLRTLLRPRPRRHRPHFEQARKPALHASADGPGLFPVHRPLKRLGVGLEVNRRMLIEVAVYQAFVTRPGPPGGPLGAKDGRRAPCRVVPVGGRPLGV